MRTLWQVKVSKGFGTGTHTFRTRKAAQEFVTVWRKASDSVDASVTLLRNGQPI